ncbi:hypothetical protein Tco_0341113, partial [Tanacetum coccineum]
MVGSDNESDDASVHSEATISQQQRNIQPQIITTVSNNNAKFPYLKKDEYEQGVSKTDFENYVKANDAVLRNMQNQGQGLQNQMTNLTEMLSKFISSNTASSSNSGTLPSQTVTNPREHENAITTRSGKTCEGPSTPLVPTPVVSTPLKEPEQNSETMKVRENDKPSAQHNRFLKMFKQLHLEIGLKDALIEMPKFNKWLSGLLRNKEKLEEIAITSV